MNKIDIIGALQWRYATKQFDTSKKIDEETLSILIEALRLAPSSNGLELRGFVIVQDPTIRQELRAAAYDQKQITDASHLFVLCRKTHIDEKAVIDHVQRISEVRGTPLADLEKHQTGMIRSIQRRTPAELEHWASRQVYIPL